MYFSLLMYGMISERDKRNFLLLDFTKAELTVWRMGPNFCGVTEWQ